MNDSPVPRLVALSIIALTLGHVFSNAVRTLPAVAADLLQSDLGLSAESLGALTAAFPFAFALAMVPVGAALDRYGIKPVSLTLLAIAFLGALGASLATGPATMLAAQCVLGIGCSGMLMAPVTFAAKSMAPARFGLWAGLIQALGNTGMVLSASPLAILIEYAGWRAGFLACAAIAAIAWIAVALIVREPALQRQAGRSLWADAREVLALAVSPRLAGVLVIAFASFAAVLGVRGLWGGPWLMEVKGMGRVAAGTVLFAGTLALIAGPVIAGALERRFPARRRALLAAGHFGAAGAVVVLVLGGPFEFPAALDTMLFTAFGLLISFQVLCFALVRSAVPPEQSGRALSAMNMFFFGGAAVMQGVSGVAAGLGGVGWALLSFAAALAVCTGLFLRIPGPR
ncbi:MAG TPA: MFS transporter [Acetobacteraceae bacterium]|nr:MFS transporter [Acetobacteraceae bacterium]